MEIFAQSISAITGLNIWLFPREEETVTHIPGRDDLREMEKKFDISSFRYLLHEEEDPALLFRDNLGFSYVHGEFRQGTIVCGPFFDEESMVPGRDVNETPLSKNVPSLSPAEIQAIGQLIRLFADQRGARVLSQIPQAETEAIHNPAHEDLNQMNREIIDRTYELERKMRNLVAAGDKEGLQDFLQSFTPTKTMIHMLPNPIRQSKNGSIILNTILRLSAERGGIIPILLHGMSTDFAEKIEAARSMEELSKLRDKMCMAYCDAVQKFSLANHSQIVKKTAEYVITHLDEKLSLSDLAEQVSCSAPYLARQFRKEYGMSVGEFIREKKIDEAKYMLANSTEPLADISIKLGFDDMGYFSRVFRKIVGKPPTVYREHMSAGRDESIPL